MGMSSSNVELHIEELVLDGFVRGQRYEIAEAIGRELERLLAGRVPQSLTAGSAVDRLDAGVLEIRQAARPEAVATIAEQARALKDSLAPWHPSYSFYNLTDTPAPAQALLPPDPYQRLQQIKNSYDPDDAIISAHPV